MEYPVNLLVALDLFRDKYNSLSVSLSEHSIDTVSSFVEVHEMLYHSFIVANEFMRFYDELMKEED